MEEAKAYIESGILELYVLGELSQNERIEVEAMSVKHPAIKAELTEIERSMERYAFEHQLSPSAELRNRILNSVLTNLADDRNFHSKKDGYTDNIRPLPAQRTINFYKYAFAACLALLLASIATLISVYEKLQQSNQQILVLNTQNEHFSKTVSFQNEQLTVFRDTAYKLIKLPGTPKNPSASMMLAWSPAQKKVMIDMADMKLPENDNAHQYQLWALVGGKPVDLGVFDKTTADTTDMKEMKSIAMADAFAVTLEPKGGSVNPTMDAMMVIGKF